MSKQELLFKTLVSKLICKKVNSPEEQEKQLFEFYNQADFYYEVFCESIYMLMTRNSVNTIFMDEFGDTHLGYSNDNIVGYELLCNEDIEDSNDDIIKYIQLALDRLQYRLDTLNNLHVIRTRVSSAK